MAEKWNFDALLNPANTDKVLVLSELGAGHYPIEALKNFLSSKISMLQEVMENSDSIQELLTNCNEILSDQELLINCSEIITNVADIRQLKDNALSSEHNASSSASGASTSASEALASKASASTSASSASTSASEALASKNSATASASGASTSASNALTSETKALASEVASESSKNSVALMKVEVENIIGAGLGGNNIAKNGKVFSIGYQEINNHYCIVYTEQTTQEE
jgi:hypothetical protein